VNQNKSRRVENQLCATRYQRRAARKKATNVAMWNRRNMAMRGRGRALPSRFVFGFRSTVKVLPHQNSLELAPRGGPEGSPTRTWRQIKNGKWKSRSITPRMLRSNRRS